MNHHAFTYLLAMIVLLLSIQQPGSLHAAYSYEFGVAEQQVVWRFADVADSAERLALQLQMLDAMALINIGWIRMSLIYPSNQDEHLFAHIERCNELGIKVLIVLESGRPNFYPTGTEKRPGSEPPGQPQWPSYRLSDLDLDLTEAVVRSFFEELQIRGLEIHALEIFNEVNWNSFNGDLPLVHGGLLIDENTPWDDPVYEAYRLGLRKKGEMARRIDALDKEILNGDLKLITAGLVGFETMNLTWFANNQGGLVSAPLTLQLLQGSHPLQVDELNYLDYFDGIGMHIYPPTGNRDPDTAYAEIAADLDPLLQVPGVGTTLPLWITECGYTRSRMGYDEQARLEQLNIFYEALARYDRPKSSIEAVFHFTFSQMAYPEHAIWSPGDGFYPSAAIFNVPAAENTDWQEHRFEAWQVEYFREQAHLDAIAGPMVDANFNGTVNFLEYMVGGDPLDSSAAGLLPHFEIRPSGPVLRLDVRINDDNAFHQLEANSTLAPEAWGAAEGLIPVEGATEGFQRFEIVPTSERKFYRLRVWQN